MSRESRFQKEVKPVIEEYINSVSSSFTSSDIADLDSELESDEVGRTLKLADVNTILKTGNNPATWEALYVEAEDRKYIIEPEVYDEPGDEEDENYLERALEEIDTDSAAKLYTYFRNQLDISNDSKISQLIEDYKEEK